MLPSLHELESSRLYSQRTIDKVPNEITSNKSEFILSKLLRKDHVGKRESVIEGWLGLHDIPMSLIPQSLLALRHIPMGRKVYDT